MLSCLCSSSVSVYVHMYDEYNTKKCKAQGLKEKLSLEMLFTQKICKYLTSPQCKIV